MRWIIDLFFCVLNFLDCDPDFLCYVSLNQTACMLHASNDLSFIIHQG